MGKKGALVQGLFTSAEVQLANIRDWNRRLKWGFTEDDFEVLGPPPRWPVGSLKALVLTPYLSTVGTTFNALVDVAEETSELKRWGLHTTTPKELRLARDVEHRRGLRWARIDLGANRGFTALARREPSRAPHAEVLAAAAHFPEWTRQMNGATIPYAIVAGYEYDYRFGSGWSSCIVVSHGENKYYGGPAVAVADLDGWDEQHAVPELVGPKRWRIGEDKDCYMRAAATRAWSEEAVARMVVAEIVEILAAQESRTADLEVLWEAFAKRHSDSWNSLGRERDIVMRRDFEAALQTPELKERITATGDLTAG